jgi:hypothetical protein
MAWQRRGCQWTRSFGCVRAYTGGQEDRRVEEVGGIEFAGDVEEGRRGHRSRRQRQGRRRHGLVPRRPARRGGAGSDHVREARARERERAGHRVRGRLDAPGRRGRHRSEKGIEFVTAPDQTRGEGDRSRGGGGYAPWLVGTVARGD